MSYPIIGLFVFLSGLTPVRDSDAWMTGNFWRHEQQFNRLAETAKDEAPGELVYVSNDCVRSRDTRMGWRCGSSVMPEDRWNQYRDLFRQVGVPWEMVRAPSGNTYLVYWRVGGDEKGYLYAPRPPLPVLDALSGLPARDIEKACKKIDGNWYLYFIYSDNMLPGYE